MHDAPLHSEHDKSLKYQNTVTILQPDYQNVLYPSLYEYDCAIMNSVTVIDVITTTSTTTTTTIEIATTADATTITTTTIEIATTADAKHYQ